ncbi:MAG: IPT/TIG domain-containing protein [Myxococcota bacterium]
MSLQAGWGRCGRVGALLGTILVLGGCGDDDRISVLSDVGPTADAGPEAGPDADAMVPVVGNGTLIVDRAVPDHGAAVGGTVVVLRGTGFTEDAEVRIGGLLVQPADTELIDSRRLQIVTPAGEPGPADIVVTVGADEITLPNGYTYDAFFVDPNRGAVSGGTLISLTGTGTAFEDGDTVTLGRTPCLETTVISETQITCRTPPFAAGSVDVMVTRVADASEIIVEDGYTYFDSVDPLGGGLGGGPIMGNVNVNVIDAATGAPVPEAFTILGEDLSTPNQGLTDLRGQITFSTPDLAGPQTIHVSKTCFERTSFVAFDARDVTIFLVPLQDPSCGMGGDPPPPGRGRFGTWITGELIWRGPRELGPNPWGNIPDPRENEEKVAYVYTTQARLDAPNPDPNQMGSVQRVLEQLVDGAELGYPYRIFARPAGLAVYALAGLENIETGEFIPYVTGVARSVLGGPGQTVTGADVVMDIPLDHRVDVELEGLPAQLPAGTPNNFRVEAYIDLGGEGVMVREVNGQIYDEVTRRTASQGFRFFAQPALFGALSDGRYRIISGWHTGTFFGQPETVVVETGVRNVNDPVVIRDFLGIPQPTAPAFGQPFPADRILRWTHDGPTPDFYLVLMVGGDGFPAWRHFTPGTTPEAPIPDLSMVPEIEDVARGDITWVVYAINVPGFDFDEFSYTYLSNIYWSKWSDAVFQAQFL